jgi:hypothetical protein
MHFDFHFTAGQIIFTLTFAAQLVLLVVLLGRDRASRFPWFTLAIVLMALRLLAIKLLQGRMAPLTFNATFIILADLAAIIALLVLVEMARRAFAPVKRSTWLAWALTVLIIGGGILYAGGRPWPAWKTLTADSFIADLRLMQMGAQRLDMLVDLLTVELGLLVILFGRRNGAGWRSHTQRIVIGLSTASAGQLAAETIWQLIARNAVPHSQAEYDRIIGIGDKLNQANGALYIAVLIWWIVVLWMDEPGAATNREQPSAATPQPEYLSSGDQEPEQPPA